MVLFTFMEVVRGRPGARAGGGGGGCLAGGISHLLPHLPQALQTMEQVAAPQQLAAKDTT